MITRLLMVMTLDGVIAKNSQQSSLNWSSPEDKELYKSVTKESGVMIMGERTFATIGRPLPGRLIIVLTETKGLDQPGVLEYKSGDLKTILTDLAARGVTRSMICGGTYVNSKFLKENLIDEIQITIEPKLFGSGMHLFDQVDVERQLKLIEVKHLNNDTLNLLYKVIK